jgi:uncharacterized membrane protein
MKKILRTITALTLLMLVAVLLNIPILREITAFIYLSFVPGFLILRILKLGKTNLVDTLLFSIGLSLAFLMLVGLWINESYLVGVSRPLSTVPLVLGVSLSTTILLFVCYKRNLLNEFGSFTVNLKVTNAFFFRCAILVLLPVLGVVGALFLNIPILLLLIALIAVLFVLSILSKKLIPSEFYPLLIFSVSLALLFSVVFTSKYIIGFDANLEYYVFKLTQTNGHWSFISPSLYTVPTVDYASMLSLTILPTIYQSLMNISGETVFKLIYPFIFSLVPVVLYRLYEKRVGRLGSLVSVLFLISGVLVFYGVTPISLDRQIVGMLFFTLSIFVLLKEDMTIGRRRLLLIAFGAALVVSHYSLMYLYLAFISFIYIVSKIKGDSDKVLNGIMVLFFFVATFSWYSLSVSPLISLTQLFSGLFSRFFADLLSPAARTTESFLSQPVSNPINAVSVAIFFIANSLVALGILRIIFRLQKTGFDSNYRTIAVLSTILLFLSFALPNFAPSLNIDRFYAISLLFLAPCFVLGFNVLLDASKKAWQKISSQHFSRNRPERIGTVLLCVVLVSFFLTQTGFVNRITGNTPLLRSLDLDRLEISNSTQLEISFYGAYLPKQDVFGAVWLHEYAPANSIVFADYLNQVHVLTSYGLIPLQLMRPLTNTTILSQGSFIYLGRLNIINGVIITSSSNGSINSSEVLPLLNQTDVIYSNGNTEVRYAVQ